MRFISFGALTLILFSVVTAVAATNTVPATRLDDIDLDAGFLGEDLVEFRVGFVVTRRVEIDVTAGL